MNSQFKLEYLGASSSSSVSQVKHKSVAREGWCVGVGWYWSENASNVGRTCKVYDRNRVIKWNNWACSVRFGQHSEILLRWKNQRLWVLKFLVRISVVLAMAKFTRGWIFLNSTFKAKGDDFRDANSFQKNFPGLFFVKKKDFFFKCREFFFLMQRNFQQKRREFDIVSQKSYFLHTSHLHRNLDNPD